MRKRIFTFVILTFILSYSSFAIKSQLNVINKNCNYYFTFNGYKFDNLVIIQINDISQGYYRIEVYKKNLRQCVSCYDKLLFYEDIYIPYGKITYAYIDRYGWFNIIKSEFIIEKYDDEEQNNTMLETSCMTNHDLQILKRAMRQSYSDQSKFKLAKDEIAVKGVKSLQVLTLMNELPTENFQLILAKYAYYYTVDKSEYNVVNNGLNSESIDELNYYIYRWGNDIPQKYVDRRVYRSRSVIF